MNRKIYLLLLLFLLFPSTGNTIQQDTIPPTYTWISPEKLSVLTTNTIRLSVDANDNENGSGIEKVVFYANYYESNNRYIHKHKICEVKDFPYEFNWDCSDVPDQHMLSLMFYCYLS